MYSKAWQFENIILTQLINKISAFVHPEILLSVFIKSGLYPKPAQSFGEKSVDLHRTTRRYYPEYYILQCYLCDNLKS
jgi:hypothetical protein